MSSWTLPHAAATIRTIKEDTTATQWTTEEETMGWDGRFVARSDIKQEVHNLWDGQKAYQSDDYFTVEKHEVFGNNHALAVSRHSVDTKVKEVFAVVVLTSYRDGELLTKDIPESGGPMALPVTKKFLSMLSDTDDNFAIAWRKGCATMRARNQWLRGKLVDGARIEMEVGIHYDFGEGDDISEKFTYKKIGRIDCVALPSGGLGRLPRPWRKKIVAVNDERFNYEGYAL